MDRLRLGSRSFAAVAGLWIGLGVVGVLAIELFGGPRAGALVVVVLLLVAALIAGSAASRVGRASASTAQDASGDWRKAAFDFRYHDSAIGRRNLADAIAILAEHGYEPVGAPRAERSMLWQRFARRSEAPPTRDAR